MFSPDIAFVLLAVFGGGFIDAMAGGGGLLQLPALFATYPDAPPPTLLGTSKFGGIFGVASAVLRYSRRVSIPWRSLLPLAALVVLASFGGARLATIVAPEVFRPLVPVMLLIVLVYMVRRRDLGAEHAPRAFAGRHHVVGTGLMIAIGVYDGFFGPGTGSFLMFVFVRCYGFDFLHASAAARVMNLAGSAAALTYFAVSGSVLWPVGAAMAICNVGGALLGARMALRGGSQVVRRVFIAVVGLLIVRTAWDAL